MLAYARGDSAAFDVLYAHYRGELYRYFLRQCGNRALAEEMYQELWLKVIKNRSNYEHKARFSTWLYRIAYNLLQDHFRRGEPQAEVADLDELEAGADANPSEQYVAQEQTSRFLDILQTLPEAQRQVFLLKEEAGLSLEEIAAVTATGFEVVKSRLRYAVAKLRKALEDAA